MNHVTQGLSLRASGALAQRGLIFWDPASNEWVTREEYLSRDVVGKLIDARATGLEPNIKALEEIQPLLVLPDAPVQTKLKVIEALGIEPGSLTKERLEAMMDNTMFVRLGSGWIPASVNEQFGRETLNCRYLTITYAANTWRVDGRSQTHENLRVYGTPRRTGLELLELTLNLREPLIYDTVDDKAVLNQEATERCRNAVSLLRERFLEWIWQSSVRASGDLSQRAIDLTRLYNDRFNRTVPRRFNGQHLTFPGINPKIQLRPHQKDQVWRILQSKAMGMYAAVGAGKTFTMIAAALELRRMGLAKRPVIACLNSTVEQFVTETKRLYPAAKVLTFSENQIQKVSAKVQRRRFLSRIATGDWDLVILSHTQFFNLKVSPETERRFLRQELSQVTSELKDMMLRISNAKDRDSPSVKDLERVKRNLESRIRETTHSQRKEEGLTWEQLGIDALFLDESQQFKNLHYITKQRGIAGMPNTHSQRAQDTYMKVRWMIDRNHRVVFSTGTPVSNSPAELFTQMRYLMNDRLEQIGLDTFDNWSTTFGETVTAPEITPSGKYKMKTRFAKFCNLPELVNLFRETADILTEDDLNLDRPKAHLVTTINQPTDKQRQYMKSLSARADAVQQRRVKPEQDNMLSITSDGRKCSLDPRLVGIPENHPDAKINNLAWNLWLIWQATTVRKATQIVFCDLRAGVYSFLVETLKALGIPGHEIAIAQEHKDKKALYAQVNRGQVRILIGSTETLGTGVNVQERLIAAHHLDAPWRPADIVQREGRIIRQGNMFKDVWIFRYVCQGSPDIASFDSFAWQVLENKAKFMRQGAVRATLP